MVLTSSIYEQFVERFSVTDDTAALGSIRQEAFDAFKKNGFPAIKNEYWRFTNVRPFISENYSLHYADIPVTATINNAEAIASIPDLDAYKLVLFNGSIQFELSQLPDSTQVSIQPVSSIKNADFFLSTINKQLDLSDAGNSFAALNTAFFNDGYAIEVKAGVLLDKPIHIYQIFDHADNLFVNTRNWIMINKNAHVEIIETADCVGDAHYFINSVTDITISNDAFLKHSVIQGGQESERWVNHTQVDQQPNSHYENYIFSVPAAALIRNNLNVELNGTYTETHMYGLYIVGKNQLIDNHSLVGHRMPHCDSNQLYKGVMLDGGKGVFNGRIYVHPDAQKTNAYQSSKNMLFSDNGSIHVKPQLEIYADDVKCSHGTTIGQFDPEMLFYLQSRGIDQVQAKAMLVNAFSYDVSNKISNEALRNYVEDLVHNTISSALYKA